MDSKDYKDAKRICNRALKTSNSALKLFEKELEGGNMQQAMEYLTVAQEATELATHVYKSYVANFGFIQR